MAHRTLVGGTAYDIKNGRCLVDGTAYEIRTGRTLVGGTAYEVKFGSLIPVYIEGSTYDEASESYGPGVIISGIEYIQENDVLYVYTGDEITTEANLFVEGSYQSGSHSYEVPSSATRLDILLSVDDDGRGSEVWIYATY